MKNKIIFKTLMLKGEAGSTIVSMEKTGHVGTADIYTITFNDGSTTEISLENMSAITSVEMTSSTDTEDIYTITCADGSTQTFSVLNHNADIAAMSDDIDTIDARVDNFINSVVPNTVETLWTGSIKDVGDSATLSKAVSNFDYIDLYLLGSADSKYIRVPATQTAVEIHQQNLSDDASSNFLRLWEMGVSISGSTVSITKSIAWAWDDPNNSNPTVTANAQNSIPITRIDGVKVASDTPAEVTDIRVGADGTTYNSAGAAVRGQISDLKSGLSTEETARINAINGESTARKNADNILSTYKINMPLDANNQPTDGTNGQMLRTNGDGSTEWVDEGLPTDEQTADAVAAWLDDHPEATTTVLDGAITVAKLGSELQAKQATIINAYNEFVNAINDGDPNSSYVCKKIIVDNPVQLTTTGQCIGKSFSNGIFELNSNLFTWQTPSNYYSSPNFVGCTFIGNGNSIFVDGAYTLGGNFVNCNFIDCAFVHNATFVQSPKFINCYFENTVNNTFIHTERAYEARFISCRAEAQNKAMFIDAYGTTFNTQTLEQITFANCVIEGQSNYVVKTHDCNITINNCYTEANSMPFVKVLATNRASAILSISITDTKIDMPIGTNFVEIDSTYENTKWSHFVCKNTSVSRGNLININNLHYFDVDGVRIVSGGTRLPSKELSKVYPQKNSVIEFSGNAQHCIVKKFPCLITFDSSDGGWHTNLYFVSLSHNNTPKAICLSDPTKTPSAVYDSETGYVDVTLHANRGVYGNSSAVLLDGLVNDLIRNNVYDATYSGYNV